MNQLSDLREPGGGSILPSVYPPQRRLTGEGKEAPKMRPLDIKEKRRRKGEDG